MPHLFACCLWLFFQSIIKKPKGALFPFIHTLKKACNLLKWGLFSWPCIFLYLYEIRVGWEGNIIPMKLKSLPSCSTDHKGYVQYFETCLRSKVKIYKLKWELTYDPMQFTGFFLLVTQISASKSCDQNRNKCCWKLRMAEYDFTKCYKLRLSLCYRVEKYRPNQLDDLISHREIISTSKFWLQLFHPSLAWIMSFSA